MKILNGRYCFQWKMGFVETLVHLKTPPLSLLSSVHRALGGLSYSNIVPVNRYVYLFILCLYMHCLILVISYVYVSADCSIEKGNSAIFLHLFTMRKSNETKLFVKTYSGSNQLDADQGDQLIERLRRCGASILLLCCREGLCYCFFELSSASCYE